MKFSISILASLMMVSSFAFAGDLTAKCLVTGYQNPGDNETYDAKGFAEKIDANNEATIKIDYMDGKFIGEVKVSFGTKKGESKARYIFSPTLKLGQLNKDEDAKFASEYQETYEEETGENVFNYLILDAPKNVRGKPLTEFLVVCGVE